MTEANDPTNDVAGAMKTMLETAGELGVASHALVVLVIALIVGLLVLGLVAVWLAKSRRSPADAELSMMMQGLIKSVVQTNEVTARVLPTIEVSTRRMVDCQETIADQVQRLSESSASMAGTLELHSRVAAGFIDMALNHAPEEMHAEIAALRDRLEGKGI